MRNRLPDRVRLGVFEVDLRVGELRNNNDQRVILTEQPLRILRMLVEADGDLVEREKIRKSLWPNDTVVEFDRSINAATSKLRQALGDSADQPKYIETIPRRGYRLLVPVERLESASEVASDSDDAKNFSQENRRDEAPALPASANANLIGKKVSHYRVLEVLGGGGMGMLYKAEDLKLGRQVALKFLPEEMAWDTLALQRFEREARTASSLDHPNICTIYENEEHEGQPFIVMQLLQGETLRDRLAALAAQQKKLPFDALLDIALQICDGLRAAHAKGIVHRDIKPANIFLTKAGQVKILDFGLAKLVSTPHEDGSDGLELGRDGTAAVPQPAISVSLDATLTRLGAAMGTAGYMSPEQVRGEKLDVRTDIFSFGLVLYEMATGQRAFTGETAAIVHNAILNDASVPATQLNPEIPHEFEAIVDKALEKDREQRYQTAEELHTELQSLRREASSPSATASVVAQPERRRFLRVALSSIGMLAIVTILAFGVRRALSRPQWAVRQVTNNPLGNRVTAGAISPDGKYLAFTDQTGLYLRNIESGETHLAGLRGALPSGFYTALFWFPSGGKLLADIDGRGLWVIPVSGGEQPRQLYQLGSDPAIAPDGRTVAFIHHTFESGNEGRHELWVINANGEGPRKLVDAGAAEYLAGPTWSPDGQWIAYGRPWKSAQGPWRSAIEASPISGGPPHTLLTESSLPESATFVLTIDEAVLCETWSPDWRLVFVPFRISGSEIKNSLWQVRVKSGTAESAGSPEQLTQWEESFLFNPTVTTDRKWLAFVKNRSWLDEYLGELSPDSTSMKLPRSFGRVRPVVEGPRSWTPDGEFLLVESLRNGRREILKQRPGDTVEETLVADSGDVFGPESTPDGSWLLYWKSETGATPDSVSLMRQPMAGGPAAKVLEVPSAELDELRCRYSPQANPPCVLAMKEGEGLVFYSLDPIKGKGRQLGKIEVLGYSYMRGWDLSPDGSQVAVVSAHKDTAQVDAAAQITFGARVDVLTLSDGSWRRILAEPADRTISGDNPQATWFYRVAWTADGKGFYVVAKIGDSSNLLHVTSDGKMQPLIANGSFQDQNIDDPLPSPDGKYLVFVAEMWDGNAWMIDNF